MESLAHQFTDAFEDTPTAEIEPLGSLVAQPAIAIRTTTPVAEAARLLVRYRVPALAVVDAEDRLRGLVTRTDALRGLDESHATAADAMSGFVLALPTSATIERAAALMAYEGVGLVCVTDANGKLVGMVSAVDVARHYAARTGYLHDEE